ncbi:MAG: hypothetical protein J6U54_03585 [Clostridiales bacterium]|nr:hypothetical protein [Clostridiales bacterium]
MLDFLSIATKSVKRDKQTVIEVYPKFRIMKSRDLMIRGGDFYAVFNEDTGLWSTEEDVLNALIDREVSRVLRDVKAEHPDETVIPAFMWDSDSGSIDRWHKYVQKQCRDNFHPLDDNLCFANTELKRECYVSKTLPYPLEAGSYESWDKIVTTLYAPEEQHKIEWAIGAIVNGDSKRIQKFLVFYGAPGTGKSTILNIIDWLFEGYTASFDAKALGSANAQFALEPFKENPLVAIQHDGDLSRIEDNTRLNSLVAHEKMTMNAKYTKMYATAFRSFLLMATNKPVKITDSRSGILRRLIDVSPSGKKLSTKEYNHLMRKIPFELGAIAWHCKEVYEAEPDAYDRYTPIRMMGASNDFYNFMLDSYPVFKDHDGTTLKAAWDMYKAWVDEAKVSYPYSLRVFKEEMRDYFWSFEERANLHGDRVRNYYKGFRTEKFEEPEIDKDKFELVAKTWIDLKEQHSILDDACSNCLAQYANDKETPSVKWERVKTRLKDLDTSRLHYVKVPENHIVIDFDIPDDSGNKCFEKNLEAASKWPKTYAELSKSGAGIHLHYIYTGDVSKLSRVYADHVEIKVFTGLSSLRRKLTKCNDILISSLSSGLPLKKGGESVIDHDIVQSEKGLRTIIQRCLNKEIHADTTSNVNFIQKKLDDAYATEGFHYDVSDMYGAVLAFAARATNQSDGCIKKVAKMHFKSKDSSQGVVSGERKRVFFDCESFPNLFLVNWKFAEDDIQSFDEYKERLLSGKIKPCNRLINPSPTQLEELLQYNLVGFNNLSYDNLMVYASYLGYTPEQSQQLSDLIIQKNVRNLFREAKNISETDVYDFASASNKKSLKKLEVDMGIPHKELGMRWDRPVPEEKWEEVAEYCDWDVYSTEAAFWYLEADWIARQILADIAELTTNDSTNTLTTKMIFGNNKHPQNQFCYRDLSKPVTELHPDVKDFLQTACPDMMDWWYVHTGSYLPFFEGYKFEIGKSTYLGEEVGEGGRVYAEPGMHWWDALLDVSSMHPHSTIAECLFGPVFTARFKEIVDGRVSIKHEAWDIVDTILGGKLRKYIQWVEAGKITSKQLANALKTAINSVYGLTAAKFDNPFKDPRNIDNIVAKRGALFMMNLEQEVKKLGFTVAHIKTDSIKIPNATKKIIDFVMEYGKRYGYSFEHEATYERMCLVNDAVYIARYAKPEDCEKLYGYVPGDNKKHGGEWTATGKQFAVPYVFKTLFTHEDITFEDMCEVLSVKTALYLKDGDNEPEFIGRVSQFCPIKPGCGGKELLREGTDKDGNVKYGAATGTKGYLWLESATVKEFHKEDDIDRRYYDDMVTKAVETISQFGDFEQFVDLETVRPFHEPEGCYKSFEECPRYKNAVSENPYSLICFQCPYHHVMEVEPDICENGYDLHDLLPF